MVVRQAGRPTSGISETAACTGWGCVWEDGFVWG